MATSYTQQCGYRGRTGDTVALNNNTDWAALENNGWNQPVDVTFRVRIQAEETNNKNEVLSGAIEYSLNGGAWTAITTTSNAVKAVASGQFNEDDTTTKVLTSSTKTFAGGYGVEDGVGTGIALQNACAEWEYALQLDSTYVANGNTIQIRLSNPDGWVAGRTVTITATAATVVPGSITGDAVIFKTAQQSITGDAVVLKTVEQSITADAEIVRFNAKVGSFNVDDSLTVGQYLNITGVPFTPKVVFLFHTGSKATSDSVSGGMSNMGFSVLLDSSNRWNMSSRCDDDFDVTKTVTSIYDNFAGMFWQTTDTIIDGHFDFYSANADGFTLDITNAFNSGSTFRISFLALGGPDITDTAVGKFSAATTEGNYNITSLSFEPTFLLTADGRIVTIPDDLGHLYFNIGMATASDEQGAVYAFDATNLDTTDTGRYAYDANLYAQGYDVVGNRGAFVSFLSNGFTLNHITGTFAHEIAFFAMAGPQVKVGWLSTRTDSNDIVATPGFPAKAILFLSHNTSMATEGVMQAHARFTMGAATSSSERAAAAFSSENALGSSEVAFANSDSAVYLHITDDALVGAMDLTAIGDTTFTCVMDDTDPAAAVVLWAAFGDAAGYTTVPGSITGDAVIFKTTEGSITGDAVVFKTTEQYITADAWIVVVVQDSVTADAVVLVPDNEDSVTADAVVLRTEEDSVTADAVVLRTEEDSVTADAVVFKVTEQYVTGDARILVVVGGSITGDAVVFKTTEQFVTGDARILVVVGGSITGDAVVFKTTEQFITGDAWIVVSGTVSDTFTGDAVIKVLDNEQSIVGDAVVLRTEEDSFTADAWVVVVVQGSVTGDAVIFKTTESGVTGDAVVKVPDNQQSISGDAVIQKTIPYKPWDPDNEGLPIWAAYQPKYAESYNRSLRDLSGNNHGAGTGTQPAWDEINGWKFNGTTHYLTTSFVPEQDGTQTVIVQYTNCDAGTSQYLCGTRTSASNSRVYLAARSSNGANVVYGQGLFLTVPPELAAGNLCVAGNQGYRNGVADGGPITAADGSNPYPLFIGCMNYDGSPNSRAAVYIQALFIYDGILTPEQVRKVSEAMKNLPPPCEVLADAVILKTAESSITGDAVVFKVTEQYITGDAWILGVNTVSDSITADAVVLATLQDSLLADAVVFKTTEQFVTGDAFIIQAATVPGSVTGDAVILRTEEDSVTGDAVILRTEEDSVTADAVVLKTIQDSLLSDAVVLRTEEDSVTVDAVVLRTEEDSVTGDAVIFKATEQSIAADAVVFQEYSFTFSADARITDWIEPPETGVYDVVGIVRSRLNDAAIVRADSLTVGIVRSQLLEVEL